MVGGCELLQDVTSFAYNSYTASKKTRRESRPKAALRNGDHLDFVCLHGVPGNARQEDLPGRVPIFISASMQASTENERNDSNT